MNNLSRPSHRVTLLLCIFATLVGFAAAARSETLAISHWRMAAVNSPAARTPPATPAEPIAPTTADEPELSDIQRLRHHHVRGASGNEDAIVNVFHDSTVSEGQHADDVVSVLGSSTSAGNVSNSVVSVLGNTRVTGGSVGDSAVAVLGSVYVDATVSGDVVAVLGNVELGPHADVGGDLVAVAGTVKRDPAATVHGKTQNVGIGATWNGINALQPWIKHCLLLGRPLAFVPGIAWAWTMALVALAIYVLCALLFGPAVDRCVQTLESHPGQSLLSAVLALIGTPMVFLVLFITVVGIIAVPILGMVLLLTQTFGKLVMLAWIGRRLTRTVNVSQAAHTALAVLVGGLIVMALYTVPVLGFILYKLLSIIGVGAVVYTLLLLMQARRAAAGAAAIASVATAGVAAAPGAVFAAPNASNAPPAQDAPSAAEPQPTRSAQVPPVAKSAPIPAASAISLPRAGFWIRMVALLFDVILVAVVLHLLLRSSDRLFLVILATYGAVMWKLRGSTVGGIIFNLQVVQQDGREMEWSTAIVRALSSFLSLIAIGIGFIWIAVDPENRAWHDKIAGTIVVRVP